MKFKLELKNEEYKDGFGFRINNSTWDNHNTIFFYHFQDNQWRIINPRFVRRNLEEVIQFIAENQTEIPECSQLMNLLTEML